METDKLLPVTNITAGTIDQLKVKPSLMNNSTNSHCAFIEGRSADELRSEILRKLQRLTPSNLFPATTTQTTLASTSNSNQASAEKEPAVATEKETTNGDTLCRVENESLDSDTVTSNEDVESTTQKGGGQVNENGSDALRFPATDAYASTAKTEKDVDTQRASEERTRRAHDGETENTTKLRTDDSQMSSERRKPEALDEDRVDEIEEQRQGGAEARSEVLGESVSFDGIYGDPDNIPIEGSALDADESHKEEAQVDKFGLENRTPLDVRCDVANICSSEAGDIPTPLDAPTPCEEENVKNDCSQYGSKNFGEDNEDSDGSQESSDTSMDENVQSDQQDGSENSEENSQGDGSENSFEREERNSSSSELSTSTSTVSNGSSEIEDVEAEFRESEGEDFCGIVEPNTNDADTSEDDNRSVHSNESDKSFEADDNVVSEEGDVVPEEEVHEPKVDLVPETENHQTHADVAEDFRPDADEDRNVVSKKREHAKVPSIDLWSASEVRKNASEIRQKAIEKEKNATLKAGQTKFNLSAPKYLSSATLKGPNGINIMSILSLAPQTTHVDFIMDTNSFHVTCDQRVAPVARFLLDQLVTTEKVLKDQNIHPKLDSINVRIYAAQSIVQLGHQFAEVGECGFQFHRCYKNKMQYPGYRLSLYKAPIGNSVFSRKGGDFHPPTDYAVLHGHLFESCKNAVRMMRITGYDVNSMKLVFDLGDALFLPSSRSFNKMPILKSVNRNPALRNCDGIRIGHKADVKVKFADLDPEAANRIIEAMHRKDSITPTLELMCHLFHSEHGTVRVVFDILPQTATLDSNNCQIRISRVIRRTYTTHEAVVLCNAHPSITPSTATRAMFPVDYRWRVQANSIVSPEIHRAVSSYVQNWKWSHTEGIITGKNLPENGWTFKHVPKFPSFTITKKSTHMFRENRGLLSSASTRGSIVVERRTEYHPPPHAFVYLFEKKCLGHPAPFQLREYTQIATTSIGGTCFDWDKDRDMNDIVMDTGVWKEEIRRVEQLLETLVKG